MSLWLFSSGDGDDNAETDRHLISTIKRPKPRLTFIPSSSKDADYYYSEFIQRFEQHGYQYFSMLAIDQPVSEIDVQRALDSDLIYLSGGNTFYFLKHLRHSGFINTLKRYHAQGGILAGTSAGAIVMTPNIKTASYPAHDRDENFVGIRNWQAMHLANFEIFPHYIDEPDYSRPLCQESKTLPYPLFGVPDGSAICVEAHSVAFYGQVYIFTGGKKILLSNH